MKLFVQLIVLFVLTTSDLPAQLKLSVFTDKNEYQYSENIRITCQVTNYSDTSFSFLAGSYGSCQAEFSFNDFNSWEHTQCLLTTELLTIDPNNSILYFWKIDPKIYGLPNRDGTQSIIGEYYFDLEDTLNINAPMFLGGQLQITYPVQNSDTVQTIKDSLNIEILDSIKLNDKINERWQVFGYSLDSLISEFNDGDIFDYMERAVLVEYDSRMFVNHLDFYPLHIGDVWIYKVWRKSALSYEIINYILRREITGDTVMQNHAKYFIIKESSTDTNIVRTIYERIDSLNAKVYAYIPSEEKEYIIYDLLPKKEELFTAWTNYGLYGSEYFGSEINVSNIDMFNFEENDVVEYPTMIFHSNIYQMYGTSYFLTRNLGITYRHLDYLDNYTRFDTLIASFIGGKYFGDSTLVGIKKNTIIKKEFVLQQNYPNPFNPSTTINYSIPNAGQLDKLSYNVTLKVYDVLGREVATLVNKKQSPGNYTVIFNSNSIGNELPSGVYFYKLQAGEFSQTRKMILLR